MWTLKKAWYRSYQAISRVVVCFLDWREPKLIAGPGSIKELPDAIKLRNISNVLIVTGKIIRSLHVLDEFLEKLTQKGIQFTIFDGVQANPSVENIEDARNLYVENKCDAVIGFGGGSPIDCAKITAARVGNPKQSVRNMRGLIRIRHKLPPVFIVPTTAGSGSDATITAVVTDTLTHEKYAITDFKLRPLYAVLDPELSVSMPQKITSTTGMDALTHAVEAYIGNSNSKKTLEYAELATKMIFQNIERAYNDGRDIEARNQMLLAAYYAGVAFTRAYVGYSHAIAHSIGGLYGTPHGLANAVILPYVLEYYGKTAAAKLAKLADISGFSGQGQSEQQKADKFIKTLRDLNKNMNIPLNMGEIKDEDIKLITKRVLHEANLTYPVPKIINNAECEELIKKIKG